MKFPPPRDPLPMTAIKPFPARDLRLIEALSRELGIARMERHGFVVRAFQPAAVTAGQAEGGGVS